MGIKVNFETLKAALASGPLNIPALAAKLGRSSPWDLEKDLKETEAGINAMVDNGVEMPFRFTVFPARERARYGFPDVVPVAKDEDPKRNKRAKRNPAAKVQKQYWPMVAWGYIEPLPAASGTESQYDGRHDDDIEAIKQLLDEAGIEYLDIKGRMVRGGSGIYISLAKDSDNESESDETDTSGIVTDPNLQPVA